MEVVEKIDKIEGSALCKLLKNLVNLETINQNKTLLMSSNVNFL